LRDVRPHQLRAHQLRAAKAPDMIVAERAPVTVE